jgi:type III secretion protein U
VPPRAAGSFPLSAALTEPVARARAHDIELRCRALLAPAAIAWRWDRLRAAAWTGRVLSPSALGRGAMAVAAPVAALAATGWSLSPRLRGLASSPRIPAAEAASVAGEAVRGTLGSLAWLLLGAVVAEVLLVRARHRRALRMSRSEVERDVREDEGDPRLRAERRRLQRSAATATRRPACVVVNPTHLAVALRHRKGDEAAPVVTAKGAGARAAALRREARRLGIPVVHDPPLARALYRLADVGDEVPEELYEATAVVLAHVHGLGPERVP